MTDQLTSHDLAKAAANLQRIEDHLAARTGWTLETEGFEALQSVNQGAATIVEILDPLIESQGAGIESQDTPLPSQIPGDTLDNARMAKLAEYMGRLASWFERRTGYDLAPGADDALVSVYGSLLMIRQAVDSIIGSHSVETPSLEELPPAELEAILEEPPAELDDEPTVSPMDQPGSFGAPIAMPPPQTSPTKSDRLVLDLTADVPLLVTFRGDLMLTDAAKKLVSDFLTQNGIEYPEHQLLRFQAEVRRRIESTPEGQVLVVKIGRLEGEPTPYFGYQSKITLSRQ